jgi:hypothetical protein
LKSSEEEVPAIVRRGVAFVVESRNIFFESGVAAGANILRRVVVGMEGSNRGPVLVPRLDV